MNIEKGYDELKKLPFDNEDPTKEEVEIVDKLFTNKNLLSVVIGSKLKFALIIGILFFILSLPILDEQLYKLIPSIKKYGKYFLLFIKMVIFIFILMYLQA